MFLPLLIIAILIIALLSFMLVCYMLNPFKLKQFNQTKSSYRSFRSRQSSDNTSFSEGSTKYCSDDSAVICNGHSSNSPNQKNGKHHHNTNHGMNLDYDVLPPALPVNGTSTVVRIENNSAEGATASPSAPETSSQTHTDV